MFEIITKRKTRIKNFLRDAGKGFGLMWHAAKRLTVINIFLFVLQAVLPLLSLVVLKNFIDGLIKFKGLTWDHSGNNIILFFVFAAANILVGELTAYFLSLHQRIISDDMAKKVLQKSISLDLAYFEDPTFHNELYLAHQQALHRPAELISSLQSFIQNLITILLFSGFLFSVHWSIPLLLLVLSVPLAVTRLLQGYQQYLHDQKASTLYRRAYDLFESLTRYEYAKEVRIFNYGPFFIKNFISIRKAIFLKGKKLQQRFLKYSIGIQLAEIAVSMIIYGIIIQKSLINTVSIGGLVVYITAFQRLQGAINGFFQSSINVFQQQLYLHQFLKYLSLPSLSKNPEQGVAMPDPIKDIWVKELSFSYPKTNKEILKNINLHFPAGKIVAIVGENGSGKSTLVKLLCRLYEAKDGAISMGNMDINSICREDFQLGISALFQDFGKYFLSIKDNIVLKHTQNDEDELNAAVEKSRFERYMAHYALGFRTPLGKFFKNGEQLSGGQWQKLALARAFYKKSSILILDEPTSFLDPVSEQEVLANLRKELDDHKIIILISHRLCNLKIADYIYVLHEGCVVERGSFDELMNMGGLFYSTYKTQIA